MVSGCGGVNGGCHSLFGRKSFARSWWSWSLRLVKSIYIHLCRNFFSPSLVGGVGSSWLNCGKPCPIKGSNWNNCWIPYQQDWLNLARRGVFRKDGLENCIWCVDIHKVKEFYLQSVHLWVIFGMRYSSGVGTYIPPIQYIYGSEGERVLLVWHTKFWLVWKVRND